MNPNNYASLEASKRLVEAGIVLETEALWFLGTSDEWHLADKWLCNHAPQAVPAPSMAEVWMELPEGIYIYKGLKFSEAYRKFGDPNSHISINPTDALIDLLIWLRRDFNAKHDCP
jgi:hypothetical protein